MSDKQKSLMPFILVSSIISVSIFGGVALLSISGNTINLFPTINPPPPTGTVVENHSGNTSQDNSQQTSYNPPGNGRQTSGQPYTPPVVSDIDVSPPDDTSISQVESQSKDEIIDNDSDQTDTPPMVSDLADTLIMVSPSQTRSERHPTSMWTQLYEICKENLPLLILGYPFGILISVFIFCQIIIKIEKKKPFLANCLGFAFILYNLPALVFALVLFSPFLILDLIFGVSKRMSKTE